MTARYPAVGPAAWGAVEDARVQPRRVTQRLFTVPVDGSPDRASLGRTRPIVVPPPTLLAGEGSRPPHIPAEPEAATEETEDA